MIGNGLLAFAIIFVVAIFIYLSFRLQRQQDVDKYYNEEYTISLTRGFIGDSLSIYINDSLLVNKRITEQPFILKTIRFAEQSALIIVENSSDKLSTFDLSNKGGQVLLEKDENGIKLLPH